MTDLLTWLVFAAEIVGLVFGYALLYTAYCAILCKVCGVPLEACKWWKRL